MEPEVLKLVNEYSKYDFKDKSSRLCIQNINIFPAAQNIWKYNLRHSNEACRRVNDCRIEETREVMHQVKESGV